MGRISIHVEPAARAAEQPTPPTPVLPATPAPDVTRHHITRPVATNDPSAPTNSNSLKEKARTSPPLVLPELIVHQNDQPPVPPVAPSHEQARSAGRVRNGDAAITARVATNKTEAPIQAAVAVITAAEPDSSQSIPIPPPHRHPNVKVLMYATAGERECSPKDVEYSALAFLKNIEGLTCNDIRVITPPKGGQMQIGDEFDWFFDPQDIVPGDLRILLVTGHGHIYFGGSGSTVLLDLYSAQGERIDTKIICTAINKLPAYCTLEVVLGICHAGGLIPAQYRVRVMGSPSSASPAHVGQSDLTSSPPGRVSHGVSAADPPLQVAPPTATGILSIFSTLRRLSAQQGSTEPSPLQPKANVIIWAAADMYEEAYTEMLLHGRKERLGALIGAIIRAWTEEGPNVTRRVICDRVDASLKEQYQARVRWTEKRRRRSRVQMTVQTTQDARPIPDAVPQVALLLSSEKDANRVLDGHIFQPLDPPLSKSLMGGYLGGVIASAGQVRM